MNFIKNKPIDEMIPENAIVTVKSENLPLGVRWTYIYSDGHTETTYWSYEKLMQECGLKLQFF